MNFEKAFTYPFEDSEWARKLLIPALISIIPIIGQIFLLGWSLNITRRVVRQEALPLPELDFGGQIIEGLKAFVVGFVYALPIIIFSVPINALSIISSNSTNNAGMSNALLAIVSLCCGGLILVYSILLAFVLPAALTNMTVNDRLGAGFQFNQVFNLVRTAPGAYLLVLVGSIITGFIAGLGIIACGIGVLATTAYSLAVNAHLYGQAYNEAQQNKGFAKVY